MIRIKLSTLLGERRMTQKALATKTGIRPSTVNDWYNELTEHINLNHLDAICEALGCEISDVLVRDTSVRRMDKTATPRSKT